MDKKMKKNFQLLLVLMMSTFMILAGCTSASEEAAGTAGASEEDDKIVIGAALPDFSDKWLSYLQQGMEEFEAKHENVEVIYVDARNDPTQQQSQIQNFITQQVDAIAIVPVDTVSAKPMVDMAMEKDIPVVVVNRVYEGIESATAYVGGKSIDSGIMQMEKVVELLDGEGNVAIMNGTLGHEATIKRTEGNKQVIEETPGIKVAVEDTANFTRAEGLTLMENWLQIHDNIDAVVANNDEMAIGAIMALDDAGLLEDTVVAGIDGTPDALSYVKSGALDVSVFQDPFAQGGTGIEVAMKAAQGEEVEQMNYVPFELITKENVEEYEQKWAEYSSK